VTPELPQVFRDLEGRMIQIRTRIEPSTADRGLGRTGLTHYHLRFLKSGGWRNRVGTALGQSGFSKPYSCRRPVETVREHRTTPILDDASTAESRPTEQTSPESIHGVVVYVGQYVGVDVQGNVDAGPEQ
jgi:hypothetical protein